MCSTCHVQGLVQGAHLCAMPQGDLCSCPVWRLGVYVWRAEGDACSGHWYAPLLANRFDRLGGDVFGSNNSVYK